MPRTLGCLFSEPSYISIGDPYTGPASTGVAGSVTTREEAKINFFPSRVCWGVRTTYHPSVRILCIVPLVKIHRSHAQIHRPHAHRLSATTNTRDCILVQQLLDCLASMHRHGGLSHAWFTRRLRGAAKSFRPARDCQLYGILLSHPRHQRAGKPAQLARGHASVTHDGATCCCLRLLNAKLIEFVSQNIHLDVGRQFQLSN